MGIFPSSFANLSHQERNELFQQTAARRGLHPAIAEKDFWVCWALMKLFGSQLANNLVFKGGTSLSKAHHLIERFSEDIDLVLNWELLGYGRDGSDPWQELASNSFGSLSSSWSTASHLKRETIIPGGAIKDSNGVEWIIPNANPQSRICSIPGEITWTLDGPKNRFARKHSSVMDL